MNLRFVSWNIRGRGATPCRYDFVYATTDFQVSQVRYLYEEAIRAGSDHAVVVADLVMPTGEPS